MVKPAFVPCFDAHGFRRYYPRCKTTLYYIRFDIPNAKSLYKVGITTTSVEQRFSAEKISHTIIFTKQYSGGREAYTEEQHILKTYEQFRISGAHILRSGNTELFSEDIRKYKGQL